MSSIVQIFENCKSTRRSAFPNFLGMVCVDRKCMKEQMGVNISQLFNEGNMLRNELVEKLKGLGWHDDLFPKGSSIVFRRVMHKLNFKLEKKDQDEIVYELLCSFEVNEWVG